MALSTIPTRALTEQGINFRNLIINGDMSVAQRGSSFSGMTIGQYTIDRWKSSTSGANLTMAQQSFTGTDIDNFNSKNYIRFTVNTANNNCGFLQYVEDAKRFLGKTVTLSFKAKGTNPAGGIIETAIACYTGTGGSYTTENRQQYSVTSDWQTFSFTTTVQSASGLTINDADSYMYVYPVIQPTGDTSTTSWEVDVAEVQVEYGNTSSSFEVIPYDVNFKRCQRYYQKFAEGNGKPFAVNAFARSTSFIDFVFPCSTPMRAQPSLDAVSVGNGYYTYGQNNGYQNFNVPSISSNYSLGTTLVLGSYNGGSYTAGDTRISQTDNASCYLALDSEL